MQTPHLNDQQTWGGEHFHPVPPSPSTPSNENNQTTLNAHGREDAPVQALSQGGILASSSDNLFHPIPNNIPPYVFSLPNIPSNPRFNTFDPVNTFQRPLPYRSTRSSYNNPRFDIPPAPFHQPSPITVPLGPPPPIPPRIRHFSPSHIPHPQNLNNHF